MGSLTCAQMLMHAIAHECCRDTVRESALKVDSGRKIPCRTGIEPASRAYRSDALPTELYPRLVGQDCLVSLKMHKILHLQAKLITVLFYFLFTFVTPGLALERSLLISSSPPFSNWTNSLPNPASTEKTKGNRTKGPSFSDHGPYYLRAMPNPDCDMTMILFYGCCKALAFLNSETLTFT